MAIFAKNWGYFHHETPKFAKNYYVSGTLHPKMGGFGGPKTVYGLFWVPKRAFPVESLSDQGSLRDSTGRAPLGPSKGLDLGVKTSHSDPKLLRRSSGVFGGCIGPYLWGQISGLKDPKLGLLGCLG